MTALVDDYSGIVINYDYTFTSQLKSPNGASIAQLFTLPVDYTRGSNADEISLPGLTGFQILLEPSTPQTVTIDWSLGYTLDTDPSIISQFSMVQSGQMTGVDAPDVATDCTWANMPFSSPVPVTSDNINAIWILQMSVVDYDWIPYFNLTGNNFNASTQGYTYSPNVNNGNQLVLNALAASPSSFCFRVLALTADSGTDFLGNQYRSYVPDTHNKSLGIIDNVSDTTDSDYWISPPLPAPDSVASLYFDVRPTSSEAQYTNTNLVTDPSFEYDAVGTTPPNWSGSTMQNALGSIGDFETPASGGVPIGWNQSTSGKNGWTVQSSAYSNTVFETSNAWSIRGAQSVTFSSTLATTGANIAYESSEPITLYNAQFVYLYAILNITSLLAGSMFEWQAWFLDSGGNRISAPVLFTTAAGTTGVVEVSGSVAVPNGAVTVRIGAGFDGSPTATGTASVAYDAVTAVLSMTSDVTIGDLRQIALPANLITDPGFEHDTVNSTPRSWAAYGDSGYTSSTFAVQSGWASQGSQSLRVTETLTATAVSGGATTAPGTSGFPVIPGMTYTLSAHLNVLSLPSGDISCQIGFYESGGTILGYIHGSSLSVVGIGVCTITTVAPAGAMYAQAQVFAEGATATGTFDFYMDEIYLGIGTAYIDPTILGYAWEGTPGNSQTVMASNPVSALVSNTDLMVGTKSLTLSDPILFPNGIMSLIPAGENIAVIPNMQYVGSAFIDIPTGSPPCYGVLQFDWYTSAGVYISTTYSSDQITSTSSSTQSTITEISPASAGYLIESVSIFCSNSTVSSLTVSIDGIYVSDSYPSSTAPQSISYADGDTPGWQWSGQPGNSISVYSEPNNLGDELCVIDAIEIKPLFSGQYYNLYFSNDDNGSSMTPSTTSEWESKLWSYAFSSSVENGSATQVLPVPLAAKFVKIEFTNPQPQHYNPGSFQLPIEYLSFPSWVRNYFISQVQYPDYTTDQVEVHSDALSTMYLSEPVPYQTPQLPPSSQSGVSIASPSNGAYDPTTIAQINLDINPYSDPPASQADSTTALGAYALQNSENTITGAQQVSEGPPPVYPAITTVSSQQRDSVLAQLLSPHMYFYPTCRHAYMHRSAVLSNNRAYFFGVISITFLRTQGAVVRDVPIYTETGADAQNTSLNDFAMNSQGWWETYAAG